MRVLHLNPTFYPSTRDGGTSESLLLLVKAELAAGIDAEIVTTNGDGPRNSEVPVGVRAAYDGVPVTYFERFPRSGYLPSLGLVRHLDASLADFDLVHVHALFNFPSSVGMALLRRRGMRYVVSPRGMCVPWALAYRSWKKAPYWRAIERANLRGATALHATSHEEREHVRALLPGSDVFMVPNPVAVPPTPPAVPRVAGRVAFLGRLHPVKGLDVLVPAVSLLARSHPEVELVLAGPDHDGELARVQALARTLSPRPRLRHVGEVHGEAKSRFLAEAQVLALTSRSESFGRTVVEALAHGTPAVVSDACPWPQLEPRGAGFRVAATPEAVAAALRRVLEAPDEGRAMHVAARALAEEYDLPHVGAAMLHEYQRISDIDPVDLEARRAARARR